MEDRLPRKLAAILYADVAGYSRLTGEDEDATHRTLSQHLDFIASTIESNGGQVMHYAGDAVLARFDAVVDAMSAAAAIQEELKKRQQGVPHNRKIHFRIGVNLGDVIEDRGDIYGDGVNIAARLESLAEPGGICISESVRTAVGKKLNLDYEDMGDQQVKNIAEAVRAYKVRMAQTAPDSKAAEPEGPELPSKPSIVVLAFDNMSGDPEHEYFSDGVTEDIITDLSKISGLFVIARNSAFSYKGKPINVQAVSRELGVRYVLEGSVRRAGNRVRVTAQLIDGTTGGHVWAERYDRELADIFAVQDEVTQEIVAALAPKLTEAEQEIQTRQPTENLEAYDCFLRGREHWWRFTKEANAEARSMFQRAVELDPNFAMAFAWLGASHLVDHVNQWSESVEQSVRLHSELVQRAVSLDDQDAFTRVQLGMAYLFERQHELAIAEGEKAIALDPNFAHARFDLAWFYHYAGRSAESLDMLNEAVRLDPHFSDMIFHLRALCYFHLGRYEDAAVNLKRRFTRNPNTDVSRVLLAACYGHLGRAAEAQAEWREALKINPDYSLEHRRNVLPYKNPGDFERVVDGLRKAGVDGIDNTF
ncbi:MAG: adenylate/guanylate cyclase domain-containing protein [Arenicellales bacterium]|nr:adenylate/guanylate cyclase domain-containing protein [Arenicellales bacterium]